MANGGFLISMMVPLVSLGLAGLGCSVATLSPTQLYQLAISAGFPDDPVGGGVATSMVAISLRESGGCPTAHYQGANPLVPTEDSYGLWALNAMAIGATQLAALGITDPTQLYDPATNARVAFWVYNAFGGNLNTAWYINQPGYSATYQAQLPTAQAAALAVAGGSGGDLASNSGDTDFLGLSSDSASSSSFAQSLGLTDEQLVLGGIGILAVLGFAAALA